MRIYYDEKGDYLEIFIGGPKANYGENISEGVTVFKDEETDEIIGVGILNFSLMMLRFLMISDDEISEIKRIG